MNGLLDSRFFLAVAASIPLALGTACGASSNTTSPGSPEDIVGGPSTPVSATEQVPAELRQRLTVAETIDAETLTATYPAPTDTALAYDATTASGMELIQASALALSPSQLDTLADQGIVITQDRAFPSFAYGYKTIYSEDLPVYVSADSILEAVHRSFDTLLQDVEASVLLPELTQLLSQMRGRLPGTFVDPALTADLDVYLAVAESLLAGVQRAPVASDTAGKIKSLYELASAATGHQTMSLFDVTRDEDFSQFKPRGHYVDSEALRRYFRAMMWLGRVDLRLIETQGDGSQVFHRRQFDAAVALRELMDASDYERWRHIDDTIGAFVGEHDSMTVTDLEGLLEALGVSSVAEASALTDERITTEIAAGGWGAQRIASRIIIKDVPSTEPLPLDRSFSLFGQRYTVDSHTFSNVSFDRVPGRMMPEPLDVAFAALGNDAALPLLSDEFDNDGYVHGLAKTRTLVDAHEDAYWEGSIYTRWLGALRSLAPVADAPPPAVPQTSGWQRRILATQLGSWAELRHDTILYAKQSYSAGVSCEFPDAYVDPYPEFYAQLSALVGAVVEITAGARLETNTRAWAQKFQAVMGKLEQMAEDQRSGVPHDQELIDFINEAVTWDEEEICGGVYYSNFAGWYFDLYLSEYECLERDPVVADIHTQPTDEAGNDVGRVLHVGTGDPRLMVVTAQTCEGPRAYAGVSFSYGERIEEDWKRLDDTDWDAAIQARFPDPEWMQTVVVE